jgi:hypothetical protein
LKKGDIGGFALDDFGKISPTPLYKGGNIIYGQVLILSIFLSNLDPFFQFFSANSAFSAVKRLFSLPESQDNPP